MVDRRREARERLERSEARAAARGQTKPEMEDKFKGHLLAAFGDLFKVVQLLSCTL
jgi:hypothetical protein